MNKLDVIIPHLNYPNVNECLESLRRNTPEGVINKVILVDQSEEYKDYGSLVDIHVRQKNIGYAKACNTGIRLTNTEFVMCCNDDVKFVNKRWWKGIMEGFEQDDKIAVLNPSTYRDPDPTGTAVTTRGYEKYEYEDMPDEVYDRLLVDYFHTTGFCMFCPIFKRDLFNKVLGVIPDKAWFNEIFKIGGGEDYAIQWHVGKSGLKAYSTGRSWVFHWWYKTKHPLTGNEGAKYDSMWLENYAKWENGKIIDGPDCMGTSGRDDVPMNLIRE
jgi:GT2 family glycosyltransferase